LATLPAAAALILFPDVLVRVLFERREFTPAMTAATADALAAFAIGLPAYVLVKVFSPGYFARKDTKTPVRYAMTALGVNVVLNLILMFPLKHVGLALATSISAWLNAGLLMRGLYRRGDFAPDTRLRHRVPRILGATVLMMGACWGLLQVLAPWFGRGTASALLALALLVTGGMVAYGVSAFGLGAMTRADLALVRRRPPSSLPPA
jgi:putative peptidoglycan lipid II flippase